MTKKKKVSKPARTTWKRIPQKTGRQSVTKESQKVRVRRWGRIIGFGIGTCALVLGLPLGGYYLFHNSSSIVATVQVESPLQVEIQTGRFLPESWIESRLDLDPALGLMQIDLLGVKANLEKYPEIKSASVERHFPNVLRVSVQERYPFFRMKVSGKNGRYSILLVDEEGHVFQNVNCPQHLLRRIPFLGGIVLHPTPFGYRPIEGAKILADLVKTANDLYPELSRDWVLILADQLILAQTFTEGYIRVRSRTIEEILFAPKQFDKQLERLNYILDNHAGQTGKSLSRVNLSLLNQPTVEYSRVSAAKRYR